MTYLRSIWIGVWVSAAWFWGAPLAMAVTATKTTTFNPGFFWSDWTYNWTVTAAAAEIPFNDIHVEFRDIMASIDLGSYAGPGGAAAVPGPPPGPPPAGTLVITTINPAGFGNPVNFSIESVANPTTVEGLQRVYLTLNGAVVSPAPALAFHPPLPMNPGTTGFYPESGLVRFGEGTFPPMAQIDLFQDTDVPGQRAQICWGMSQPDGGTNIYNLLRPFNHRPVFVGINGTLAFTVPVLPTGDFNGSFSVDLADFSILKNHFNSDGASLLEGDANGDKRVDLVDFNQLKAHFGTTLDPSGGIGGVGVAVGVPEPASAYLAAFALAVLLLLARPSRWRALASRLRH